MNNELIYLVVVEVKQQPLIVLQCLPRLVKMDIKRDLRLQCTFPLLFSFLRKMQICQVDH